MSISIDWGHMTQDEVLEVVQRGIVHLTEEQQEKT
jgi:hypothetical protein